ncbi:hypothetical protein FACS189446_5990 [Bacteroidia bacterium]|nr:hypothetical protein FACS189446_5990 [Bacteroidia bacterium]
MKTKKFIQTIFVALALTIQAGIAQPPVSVSIDQTKDVGEIPFTSGVSPTGSMTVTVPIDIYPGIRDMQPKLALSYNHLSGNGLIGIGWNLSGLSAISRTPKNIYYDNTVQGLKLDKTDAFVLDGMRLIQLSETSDQIKYESEQGNIKATAFLSGDIVTHLEVYYPSGQKGVYGYPTTTANKLQYPLTTLSDLYGNTVTYTYSEAGNLYLVTKIAYANASVEFKYITRTDVSTIYNAGLKMTVNKLLQTVTCKFGTAALRAYTLTYNYAENTAMLDQIALSASGKTLNPLTFYYGKGSGGGSLVGLGQATLSEYCTSDELKITTGKLEYGTTDDGVIVTDSKNPYGEYRRSSSIL